MSFFAATKGMFSKGDANSGATELKEFPLSKPNPKTKQARESARQGPKELKIEKLESVAEAKDDTGVEKTAEAAEVEAEIVAEPEPVSAQLKEAFAKPADADKNGVAAAAGGNTPVKDGKNVKRLLKDPKFKGPEEEGEDDEKEQKPPIMGCQFNVLFKLNEEGDPVDYPGLMSKLGYANVDYSSIPHDVYVLDYVTGDYVLASEARMPIELRRALIEFFWATVIDCKIYSRKNKIKESSLFGADSEDEADDSSADASDEVNAEPEAEPESDRKEDAKADEKSTPKKGKKKRPHGSNGSGAKPRKNPESNPAPDSKPKSDGEEAEVSSQPTAGNDAENPAQTETAAGSETPAKPESQAAPETVPKGAGTSVTVPTDDPAFKASSIGGSAANTTIQVKVSEAATTKWDDRDILDGRKEVTPESGQVVEPAAQTEQQPATAADVKVEPTQKTSPVHDTGVEVYDEEDSRHDKEEDPQSEVVYNDFSGQIPNEHTQAIAPKPLQPVGTKPATPQPSPEPASSAAAPTEQQPAEPTEQRPIEMTNEALEAKLKVMLAEALPGLMKQSQPTGTAMPNPIPDGQPTGTPAFSSPTMGAAPASPIPANQPTGVTPRETIQSGQSALGVVPQEYTQDSQPAPSVDYQGFIPGGQSAPSAAHQGLIQGGQPAPSAAPMGHATGNGRPATSVAAAPQFMPGNPAAARRLGYAFHP